MQAGVGDQPDCAPHLQREHAEFRIGIAIGAHFLGQALAIEAPPFGIGAIIAEAAEFGQVGQFLRAGDLEMMARRAFMMGDRRDLGLLHLIHVGKVDVEDAGARSVGRGLIVEGDRGGFLPPGLDRAHLQLRLGQDAEEARRGVHGLGNGGAGIGQIGFAAGGIIGIFELGVGAQRLEEIGQ